MDFEEKPVYRFAREDILIRTLLHHRYPFAKRIAVARSITCMLFEVYPGGYTGGQIIANMEQLPSYRFSSSWRRARLRQLGLATIFAAEEFDPGSLALESPARYTAEESSQALPTTLSPGNLYPVLAELHSKRAVVVEPTGDDNPTKRYTYRLRIDSGGDDRETLHLEPTVYA